MRGIYRSKSKGLPRERLLFRGRTAGIDIGNFGPVSSKSSRSSFSISRSDKNADFSGGQLISLAIFKLSEEFVHVGVVLTVDRDINVGRLADPASALVEVGPYIDPVLDDLLEVVFILVSHLWRGEVGESEYFRQLAEEMLGTTVTSVSFSELRTDEAYLEEFRVEIGENLEAFRSESVDEALSKYLGSSIRVVPEED